VFPGRNVHDVVALFRVHDVLTFVTYALAAVMEVELARQPREQGYGVWQN
jgi:hypothetical protein